MAKRNIFNLRIKRRYLVWLKDARGLSDASVEKAAASVDRYESYVKGMDFRAFHVEKARGFKRHLASTRNQRTQSPIAQGTIDTTLRDMKAFFIWLADQSGYRSKIRHADAAYFTPARKSTRAAHGGCWKPHPSPEQIWHVLAQMPSGTVFARRDRAIVAFLFLTGSRKSAAITIRLNHVDLAARCVHFDARSVDTKFGKSFTANFFPVGTETEHILSEWIDELRRNHLWGPTDPLFPRTKVGIAQTGGFQAVGLDRRPWSSASKLTEVFKTAFASAGLPPFSPHRIRDTLAEMARDFCRTPEEYKSWSQNLAHENVLTTFMNYGEVAPGRQTEIIRAMGRRGPLPRDQGFDVLEPLLGSYRAVGSTTT